jgi:hypothetical protein
MITNLVGVYTRSHPAHAWRFEQQCGPEMAEIWCRPTSSNLMKTHQETTRYKVVKIMRKSARRQILERNLTEQEAQRLVARYPDSSRSMVVYFRQDP